MDIVVTVPMTFGLDTWIAEGDAAGDEWTGELWGFTVAGGRPKIEPGDRVYVVCDGCLRGYAPLVELVQLGPRYWELVRGGGAVATTLPHPVIGFRGWRYRWWAYIDEIPFPEWRTP